VVALMLLAVMHFIGDDSEARQIVSTLMDACAPGSFVTLSHAASDIDAEQQTEMVRRLNHGPVTSRRRTVRRSR
jgi:S-adenosyl methyltransferase